MKKLMSANWKMYKTFGEAVDTAKELVRLVGDVPDDREVVVFAPFTAIWGVSDQFKDAKGFAAGGQDLYIEDEGAFTGEIAPRMLKDVGAVYGLTGHSERRHVLGEDDELIGKKTAFGLKCGLRMVLCIGELIEERKAGKLEEVIEKQIREGVKDVSTDINPEVLSIAYEPVWAIGTGEVAGPEEIVEAHAICRKILVDIFGEKALNMRVLYGGSVKPANCSEIIELDNVDGVLVGGASLEAESFSKIVLA